MFPTHDSEQLDQYHDSSCLPSTAFSPSKKVSVIPFDKEFARLLSNLARFVDSNGLALLTRREEDVVRLVVEGMKNREIAHNLKVSDHSVRNYLYRIFEKLGVSSRVELILHVSAQQSRSRPSP